MTPEEHVPQAVSVFHGDCLTVLAGMDAATVQCVVTSPPYWGLRDYGVEGQLGLESTPELYVERMVAVFREVRRVLRDDGTLWLNLGDSYTSGGERHSGRNDTERETPGGRGGSFRGGERNALICRDNLKPKNLIGIPWRVAFALQADGWYLRSDIIWHKPNAMPESVTDRPTKAHEYLFLLSKSATYYYDAGAIRESDAGTDHTRGVVEAIDSSGGFLGPHSGIRTANGRNGTGRNKRSVWTIATQPYPEAHFATFPEDLVKPCILAGSRSGDTVLDPFVGSGTTLAVAQLLNRRAIGIELNAAYLPLIHARCAQQALALAGDSPPRPQER